VAERIERDRILRIVFDRLLKILQRAIGFAAVAEREAAIVKSFAVLRVDLDRFVEVGNGVVAVTLGAIGLAAIGERFALLLLDARLFDHRGAAGDAQIGRGVVLAFAPLLLLACERERILRGEQRHHCRRHANTDVPHSPVHVASSFPVS